MDAKALPSEKVLSVPFHGDTLQVIDFNGEPYVPMKPIVEGMGLDWSTQLRKLNSNHRFSEVMVIMTMAGADGKRYEMACLPLRKLPAWMTTVNVNKVAQAIREKVSFYIDECDEALWLYWNQGYAVNPRAVLPEPEHPSLEWLLGEDEPPKETFLEQVSNAAVQFSDMGFTDIESVALAAVVARRREGNGKPVIELRVGEQTSQGKDAVPYDGGQSLVSNTELAHRLGLKAYDRNGSMKSIPYLLAAAGLIKEPRSRTLTELGDQYGRILHEDGVKLRWLFPKTGNYLANWVKQNDW